MKTFVKPTIVTTELWNFSLPPPPPQKKMITGKNESKILSKDISYKCKWRFDEKNESQINSGIIINVYVSVKKCHACKKRLYLESCYM